MWGKNKKDGRESRESMREALRLFAYLKPYRRHFFPALACLFITAALSLAFPYLMGELIGGAVNVGTDSVTSQIDRVALTLLAVLALQAFIAYWRIRWFAFAGESGLADIRKDTYSKLVRMPMNYFSEHRVGELSSRIAADLTLIRDALILTVPQIIRQSVMLVGG